MIKRYHVFLFISVLLFMTGCKLNKKDFRGTKIETAYVSIEIDTVVLHTNGKCFEGILYQNKYLVYGFQKGHQGYRLLTLDEFGNLRSSSPLPEEIDRHWMINYSGKKDTLLAINTSRTIPTTYFFDKGINNWKLIENIETPVYEDEKYLVLKTSHGEWGGMVYFIDKNTKRIYRAYSNEVINISKFDNKYYVTNYLGHLMGHSSIFEIANPEKMQEFHGSVNDIVNNCAESSEKERYSFEGVKSVIDTTGIRIVSSFIHKGNFLQMWNEYTSSKFYITEIVNGRLECRYIFDFKSHVKYSYNINGNEHFFSFHGDDKELFGVMEINNDKIKIHFLKQENVKDDN